MSLQSKKERRRGGTHANPHRATNASLGVWFPIGPGSLFTPGTIVYHTPTHQPSTQKSQHPTQATLSRCPLLDANPHLPSQVALNRTIKLLQAKLDQVRTNEATANAAMKAADDARVCAEQAAYKAMARVKKAEAKCDNLLTLLAQSQADNNTLHAELAATKENTITNPPPTAINPAKRKRTAEDEEEEQPIPEDRIAGAKLAQYWDEPAKQKKGAASKGGRPPKSGRACIIDKARTELAAAPTIPNTLAVAAGLGPCRSGKSVGSRDIDGRPRVQFTNAAGVKIGCMLYHVTWVAHHQSKPPAQPNFTYSHLCGERKCIAPKHGKWEILKDNLDRNDCHKNGAVGCVHTPRCCPSDRLYT